MRRKLDCGLCGRAFECQGLPGCWCSNAKVGPRQMKLISLRATDCVCKDCLTRTDRAE